MCAILWLFLDHVCILIAQYLRRKRTHFRKVADCLSSNVPVHKKVHPILYPASCIQHPLMKGGYIHLCMYFFRFYHSRVFPGVHPGSAPSHTQLVAPPACRIHGPHLVLPGRPHREVRVQCKFPETMHFYCRVFTSGCICGTFRGCVRSLPCPIPMSPFSQMPMPVLGTPGNLLPSHAASLICWYVFKTSISLGVLSLIVEYD